MVKILAGKKRKKSGLGNKDNNSSMLCSKEKIKERWQTYWLLQEPLQGRSNTHRSNIMGNNIHRCYTRNKVDEEQFFLQGKGTTGAM